MSDWWKRNRWGLLALPLLLVLVSAGNGSRLERFWWKADLHEATAGSQAAWVDYREDFVDGVGAGTRSLKVRLDGVSKVDEIPQTYGDPTPIPDPLVGWQVGLSWQAEPDQIVWGCSMAVLGDDGQRYQFAGTVDDLRQDEPSACTLLDKPGPKPAIVAGAERTLTPGEERPPAWSMHPIVFLPRGVKPEDVLIWWEKPQYLKLRVRG